MENDFLFEDTQNQESGINFLEEISEKISVMNELNEKISEAEEILKELQKKHSYLSEVTVPEMLDSAGIQALKLTDGRTVSVKKDYHASISAKNKADALNWLAHNGYEDVIKADINIKINKGEKELKEKAMKVLLENQIMFSSKDSVHPSTLKSIVKSCITEGRDIPLDTFSVHESKKTVIK